MVWTQTYLDIWALKLGNENPIAREDGDMEAVAVRVANDDVAGVRYVDAVGKVGASLVADAAHEHPLLVKHHHVVSLEIAYVELVSWNEQRENILQWYSADWNGNSRKIFVK